MAINNVSAYGAGAPYQAQAQVNAQPAQQAQQAQQGQATQFGTAQRKVAAPKFGIVDGGVVSGPATCALAACCGPILLPVLAIGGFFGVRKLGKLFKGLAGAVKNVAAKVGKKGAAQAA